MFIVLIGKSHCYVWTLDNVKVIGECQCLWEDMKDGVEG